MDQWIDSALAIFWESAKLPYWSVFYNAMARQYWLYCVAALALGVLCWRRDSRKGIVDPGEGYVHYMWSRLYKRHISAAIDICIIIVNGMILISTGVLQIVANSLIVADMTPASAVANVTPYLIVLYTIVYFLVDDFTAFLVHYWFHKNSVLWAFHKVHHSAETLTPMTADRFHPVEVILTTIVRLSMGMLVTLAFALFAGSKLDVASVGQANLFLFLFNMAGGCLRHSSIRLSYGRFDHWFISPHMHQIHHSQEERHWNKNMGGTMAIWDRLFGTDYIPALDEDYRYGIGEENVRYQSLVYNYCGPFIEVSRMLVANVVRRKTG